MIFSGGTALARSILPDGRLSEDIDLLASDDLSTVATLIANTLPRALRREFPGLIWSRSPVETRGSDAAVLRGPDGLALRIQLLAATGYPRWPTDRVQLFQR